ncbi:NADH-quinone oxidoreductase subunit L [Acetobacter sp. TBRC 12305]|uniref:NADH-quinone oxidoreductase subunit L n=1 Tax=Acetobacter garciniae TaxID=2817435 RepID=A0A939HLS4_9PROT|nr:NADH-quinone oxidoreductase subunit L [Acetobacter garciniae]MBO1325847.1 NADH-quinone oxidoreductase subunit L [Acetobacter garciniae]MBX0345747.1 NADH-quinone oxidoreductase subunit L [Acetobacter garciniae]
MQTDLSLFSVAVLTPLAGAAIAGLGGRLFGDTLAKAITLLCMGVATLCGIGALWGAWQAGFPHLAVPLAEWVHAGGFEADWTLRFDTLSTTMVAMVLSVSLLVHCYSVGYMSHESMPTYRFFAYLSLFTFAMLMLVSSNDLIQLFFGWEGVGLASYLLIGYWYDRPSATAAAIKAFVVNRVADLFFIVGIGLVYVLFHTVQYDQIFAAVPQVVDASYTIFGMPVRMLEVICLLLFIGAMGKSAQLFLHTWLPDAMEGPTPVSALIHAATMVTAGVFLMARMSPLLEFAPGTRTVVIVIGATTCFFAATVGMVQPDIKRTIAYSTCSQLGYMFAAVGVGAYQAAVFHLTTHAFFKALLFLAAGSVIHAMHDEQDMFRMGGLWKKLPLTYAVIWIGSLALAGVFPLAGYWSKDAILNALWASDASYSHYAWVLGTVTAFLTAFYSWRLIFLVFHGQAADRHALDAAHESPAVMSVPLVLLAIGAALAGALLAPFYIGAHQVAFWNGAIFNAPDNAIMERFEHVPAMIALLPSVAGFAGIALAVVFYVVSPTLPVALAHATGPLYRFFLNKWYFDELYDIIFVRPYAAIARALWKDGDEAVVEGLPLDVVHATRDGAVQAVKLQTGSIAIYAFTMLAGLVVLLTVALCG